MTLTAAGFPGSVNDVQWSKLISESFNGFTVTAAGGDRTVSVATGVDSVGGVLAVLDAAQTVQLPPNPSTNPRIDRIVLRADWNAKTLLLTYKEGSAGVNPQPPSLTQNAGVLWEVSLARVELASGQGALVSGDITQENTPPGSGFYYITSIATAPDPTEGGLIYYTADKSLRVGTPSGYDEIADRRSVAWSTLTSAPVWSGTLQYTIHRGCAYVRGTPTRSSSIDDPTILVQDGVLPTAARPTTTHYFTFHQSGLSVAQRRAVAATVEPSGRITLAGLGAGVTSSSPVGVSASWPVNP